MKILIEMNEAEKQELFTQANKDVYNTLFAYQGKVAHALLLQTKHLYHDTVYAKALEIVKERT